MGHIFRHFSSLENFIVFIWLSKAADWSKFCLCRDTLSIRDSVYSNMIKDIQNDAEKFQMVSLRWICVQSSLGKISYIAITNWRFVN